MLYKNTDIHTILDRARDKTMICFGAGQQLKKACEYFSDIAFFERIDLIADNNTDKHSFEFSGVEKPVYSIKMCLQHAAKEPVILITLSDFLAVIEQLDRIPELNACECYVYAFIQDLPKPYTLKKNRAKTEQIKIPKRIHYCWFGGKPIRDDFRSYIETWCKFCPDYEIVRWDESNYDYKQNKYMYEAYRHEKWGFVSDFARLDVIYRYGGVYFDTDVELIRNIDDLLCDDAFCGFESSRFVNNGSGYGAIAGFQLILEQMGVYDRISFVDTDGSLNLKTGPLYQTEQLCSLGLRLDGTLQKIHGMTVYPQDVLSPLAIKTGILSITGNTYSIHRYSGTWFDDANFQAKEEHLYNTQFLSARFQG